MRFFGKRVRCLGKHTLIRLPSRGGSDSGYTGIRTPLWPPPFSLRSSLINRLRHLLLCSLVFSLSLLMLLVLFLLSFLCFSFFFSYSPLFVSLVRVLLFSSCSSFSQTFFSSFFFLLLFSFSFFSSSFYIHVIMLLASFFFHFHTNPSLLPFSFSLSHLKLLLHSSFPHLFILTPLSIILNHTSFSFHALHSLLSPFSFLLPLSRLPPLPPSPLLFLLFPCFFG